MSMRTWKYCMKLWIHLFFSTDSTCWIDHSRNSTPNGTNAITSFFFKKAIAQILETLQKYKQLTNKSNQQVRRRGDKEKDMSFCLKVQLSIRFLKKMRSNSNKFFIANNAVIKSCQLSIMSNFGPDHLFDIWKWSI